MSEISLFDKIIFAIIGVSFLYLAWEGIYFYWHKSRVEAGKYPRIIEDFPVHSSTFEECRTAQVKIENFIQSVLSDDTSDITLNANEINALATKGMKLDKYKPGTYIHYSIKEDFIEERYLRWPSIPGVKGCWTRTTVIKFSQDEHDSPKEINRITMEAERKKKSTAFHRDLKKSAVIRYLFNLSQSPALLLNTDSGTVDYQRGIKAIDLIRSVEILDGVIHISSDE